MKIKFIELKKPFLGMYSGITIFPYVFWYIKNKNKKQIEILKNHELIHVAQINDEINVCNNFFKIKTFGLIFGWLLWYLKYIGYWIKNLFTKSKFDTFDAYMEVPYEKEAYENQKNLKYLESREKFAHRK